MSHARFKLALLPAMGLAAALASGESHAFTAEQQQACSPDAFRLCSSEIPDIDRIRACMIRNKSQLSPQCRAFFRPGPESDEAAGSHRIKRPKPDDT
jgi:hypothetical protein